MAQLVAQVQAAQNLVNAVQRTSATAGANDHVVVVDYYLGSGTQCGPRTITGWTENVDYWREDGAANTASKRLTASTGIFVPPKAGWYKICAYSRYNTLLSDPWEPCPTTSLPQVPELRELCGHVHQEGINKDSVLW